MGRVVDEYRAFAIDLDGVVWRGDKILDGAAEGIGIIRDANKQLLFLSNNGAYEPRLVVERLQAHGIRVDEEEVLTSALVAIEWIRSHGLEGARALCLTPPEITRQLDGVLEVVSPGELLAPQVVVLARDTSFDFAKLSAAAEAVRGSAVFLALNRDVTFPVEDRVEPGTGALVAAVEAASGRSPTTLGKPEAPMMEAAAGRLGREQVLMVGDRPESDVAGARLIGWDAALVLSGVTDPETTPDPAPDLVMASLKQIGGPPRPYRS